MGYRHGDADVPTHAHGAAFDHLAVTARRHLRRACRRALILDAEGDGLRLPDDAEARGGHEHDAAVALVLVTGDQPVHGRGKTERRDFTRHVVHTSVGDEDGAGDAVLGNVGERRGQRREQARAVGLAVGLAGLDEAHLHAGDAAEPLRQRRAHRLGLLHAIAELLARALVDDDGGDRGQRIAVLAGDRWIGEREHEQRERKRADQGGAGAGEHEQERDRERNRNRRPHDGSGDKRRE